MASSQENQTVISMNNQGASLIDAGRALDAITILNSALMSFQQLILSRPHQDAFVVLGRECSLDEMMSKHAACVTKGSDTNSGFVHRRSIHVQEDKLSNVHSAEVFAAAIVFNLALAHHLTGENSNDPVLLQKAVKLYEHALALAQRSEDSIGDGSVLFHLAILNNLGQLYKELKRNVLAGKFFHQLLSMLMYLLDRSEDDTSSYEEFFSNVSHLIFPSCSAAAPAA
jgi:tetratricopeptide (TPR) repeat protein